MRWNRVAQVFLPVALLVSFGFAFEQDPPSPSNEEAAIRKTMDDYLKARNARDAEAVGRLFTDSYDQANLTMGRLQIHSGPERVRAYAEAFAERRIQNEMTARIDNLRFLTEDVALVDTELAFVADDGQPVFHNYATFVFVKGEGRWLIAAVRLAPFSKNAPDP